MLDDTWSRSESFLILTTLTARLTFDAVSVKPSQPLPVAVLSQGTGGKGVALAHIPPGGMRRGGPGTADPGRLYYPDATLKNLLVEAYGVSHFQILGHWLDDERFDIEAVMPPETTKAQFHLMLQNLLIDRFQMAMHREARAVPGYALIVARHGPKLQTSPGIPVFGDDASPPSPAPRPRRGPDGLPIFEGKLGPDGFPPTLPPFPVNLNGVPGFHALYGWRLYFQHKTMQDLVDYLRVSLHCPVIDATGLSSTYDFTLTYIWLVSKLGPTLPTVLLPIYSPLFSLNSDSNSLLAKFPTTPS